MATASDDQADKLGVDPNMAGAYEVLDLRAALSASEPARRSAGKKDTAIMLITEELSDLCEEVAEEVALMQSAFERACDEADSERAAREKAERLLAECDDELENASCPPMTNETIPERIARLAGLVSSTARDEQTALEGKVAAESRLAEAEAENARLREACRMVLLFYNTGYWTKANADEWASVTGEIDATTRVLCDTVRRALGPPALAPAAPAKEKEGENG